MMNLTRNILYKKCMTQNDTYEPKSIMQISKVDQTVHISLKVACKGGKTIKKVTVSQKEWLPLV